MSTRSNIGIELESGKVKAVYSHFDGYLEGVGKLLTEKYTDRNKIEKLIKLGSISSLGEEIGTKHDFNNCPENQTNFYCRDRDESKDDTKAILYSNRLDYARNNSSDGFAYLFTLENKWLVSIDNGPFISLTEALVSDRMEA